jgi:hypothetical protein
MPDATTTRPALHRRTLLGAGVALSFSAPPAFAQITVDAVRDFGADKSGRSNCISAFQRAMAAVKSGRARRLRIPAGIYRFDLIGDADTILVPSGCEIECERGVTFEWGYWGSPLFAIINSSNVKLSMNGATFLWTGTFGRTTGRRDALGFGAAIPAYEWCCHIMSMGSDNITIEDVRCAGRTTGNVQNAFIQVGGKADGSQTSGNRVRRVMADDVCQVLLFGSQRRFTFESIEGRRYSNASAKLYGPGHVIYATHEAKPSEAGEINGVIDRGNPLDPYTIGSVSVQLKHVMNSSVRGIYSSRPEGCLVVVDCENLDAELRYRSGSTQRDVMIGAIYFTEPKGRNQRVKIRGAVELEAPRSFCAVNMAGVSAAEKNVGCEIDLAVSLAGGDSQPAIWWVGSDGRASIRYKNTRSNARPVLLRVDRGSENNEFVLNAPQGQRAPRIEIGTRGAQRRNTFTCGPGAALENDPKQFVEADGNRVLCDASK